MKAHSVHVFGTGLAQFERKVAEAAAASRNWLCRAFLDLSSKSLLLFQCHRMT
jgi:hypothetical protein